MKELDQLVSSFTDKLAALLLKEMRTAIATTPKATGRRGVPSRTKTRVKGAKRSKKEIDQLQAKALRLIEDNAGKRIEELNAVLGTMTGELALPLKQLIGAKLVKVQGQRRGTRYFATGKRSKS